MRKSLLICAIIIWAVCTIQSQNFNYAPNAFQIPNVTQKGDLIFSTGFSYGQNFSGVDLQGIYSPVKYLAVLANYFDVGPNDLKTTDHIGTKMRFGEVGIAAYEKVNGGSVSLLAGYGIGNVFNQFAVRHQANLHLRRWFLQPGFCYTGSYFRGALALRLTRIYFSSGSIDYSTDEYNLAAIRQIEDNAPFFQPELGLSGGFLLKPVWINLTLSLIYPDTSGLNFYKYNISLSATLNLREFGHKKAKKKQ